jgi:uncharacterized protein DUF3489
MSNTSAPQDVIDAEASFDECKNVRVSALATKTLVGSRTQRRTASRKESRSKERREATKQDLVLQMLRRQSGVGIDDIVSKTHWQPHSVRGFLSAIVRKKLKLRLVSEVGKDGVRRYHVARLKAAKPRA